MRRVLAAATGALGISMLFGVIVASQPAAQADPNETYVQVDVDPGVPGWDAGQYNFDLDNSSRIVVGHDGVGEIRVYVSPDATGPWLFRLHAPEGEEFTTGPYEEARHRDSSHVLKPWLDMDSPFNSICPGIGRFDIYEYRGLGESAFAADVEWHCDNWDGPAVTLRIRSNALAAPYPPPQDTDGDGVPDTLDNCVDVANLDQVDTDQDRVGDACDERYSITWVEVYKDLELIRREAPAASRVTTSGSTQTAIITFEDTTLRSITFSAPIGQALVPGVYEDASGGATTTNPGFEGDTRYSCTRPETSFTVFEHEASADGPLRFAADAVAECWDTTYRFFVRYEADPTPRSVSGTVYEGSAPVPGVTVEAYPPGVDTATFSTTSGVDGTYQFEVPPGRYNLRYSAGGLTPQWLGGYASRSLTETVSVAGDISGLDLDAFTGGAVFGETIFKGEGAYPTEFTPQLYDEGGRLVSDWPNMKLAQAGDRYFYELQGMPAGTYRLMISVAVPQTVTPYGSGWFPDATSFFEATPISLGAKQAVEANVELWPAAKVRVNLIAPDSSELGHRYIEVVAHDGVMGSPGADFTQDQVTFIVGRGTWYVLGANYDTQDQVFWDYFAEWYSDVPLLRPDLATPLDLQPNDDVSITIELDPLFTDMFDTAFTSDIAWLRDTGITRGCDGGERFCTNAFVTRGEMAAFLVRSLGLTEQGSVDFIDDDGSIFEADIEKIAAAGITRGCNPPANTMFCPDDRVTRQQMAAFLVRGLGLTDRGSIDFVDDDWSQFEADIESLATAGITRGCNPPENDRFCPTSYVTRGQMAAFLHRALALGSDGLLSPATGPPREAWGRLYGAVNVAQWWLEDTN